MDYPVGRAVTGEDGKGSIRDAHVHSFEVAGGRKHSGLITQTHPLIETEPSTKFFFNPLVGINMNQDVSFSGAPDRIHNGEDTTLYTFSEPVGTKGTADSTDRANTAVATIVNYAIIDAGETCTVDGTVLTAGGTNWTAATDNETTAGSLADAVTAIAGGAYTGTAYAVPSSTDWDVSIVKNDGTSLASLATSGDAGEMTVSTLKAVKFDAMGINDVVQFAKGSDLTLSNFIAITMWANVDKNWSDTDSVAFVAFDTDLGIEVGNRVNLEDYFASGDFDVWHGIAIPLSDMGISVDTTVDAFRVIQTVKSGAAPTFYLDRIQVEASGTPITFSLNVDKGDKFYVEELVFSYADALDTTLVNNSMANLSYDQILGLPRLSIGFIIKRSLDGVTLFTGTVQSLGDHMSAGALPDEPWSDGTNTFLILRAKFERPLIITGDVDDILTIQINDNMSGLLQFRCAARGGVEKFA